MTLGSSSASCPLLCVLGTCNAICKVSASPHLENYSQVKVRLWLTNPLCGLLELAQGPIGNHWSLHGWQISLWSAHPNGVSIFVQSPWDTVTYLPNIIFIACQASDMNSLFLLTRCYQQASEMFGWGSLISPPETQTCVWRQDNETRSGNFGLYFREPCSAAQITVKCALPSVSGAWPGILTVSITSCYLSQLHLHLYCGCPVLSSRADSFKRRWCMQLFLTVMFQMETLREDWPERKILRDLLLNFNWSPIFHETEKIVFPTRLLICRIQNQNDKFSVHASTEVSVGVHTTVWCLFHKIKPVDLPVLNCGFTVTTSLQLDATDGTDTCHFQMAVKRDTRVKEKPTNCL